MKNHISMIACCLLVLSIGSTAVARTPVLFEPRVSKSPWLTLANAISVSGSFQQTSFSASYLHLLVASVSLASPNPSSTSKTSSAYFTLPNGADTCTP